MSDVVDMVELRRRAEAAREFDHALAGGAVTVQLRYPTRYEVERIWALARDERGRPDLYAGMRALVRASVRGWVGVTVAHALPDAKRGGEALPCSSEAVDLVLDQQTEWINDLGMAISARMQARTERLEALEKNSVTESSGSAAEPAAPSLQPLASVPSSITHPH